MPQIGSYFGSEITSVDINNDRVTDVLLVGAPMYFSESRERGKVYVYNLRQVLWPGESRQLCRASEPCSDLVNLKETCRSQLGRAGVSLPRALESGLLSLGRVLGDGMERRHLVQAGGSSLYSVPLSLPGFGFTEPVCF